MCDRPAVIDPPELGRIIVKAGRAWAITMPADLGQAVQADLDRRRLGGGPVISHPRSARWSFMIRPDLPDDERLYAQMRRLNVSVVRAGGDIALPSPADRGGLFRTWITLPQSAFRPSGRAVVDSILACVHRGGTRSASHTGT
ncbi:DNA-directed RNA polymerase subunit beta [Nocardia sp. NPDC004278]